VDHINGSPTSEKTFRNETNQKVIPLYYNPIY